MMIRWNIINTLNYWRGRKNKLLSLDETEEINKDLTYKMKQSTNHRSHKSAKHKNTCNRSSIYEGLKREKNEKKRLKINVNLCSYQQINLYNIQLRNDKWLNAFRRALKINWLSALISRNTRRIFLLMSKSVCQSNSTVLSRFKSLI